MADSEIQTVLDVAGNLRDVVAANSIDSLPELVRSTRLEPLVLLESGLRHQPYTTDLLQSITSIFSGYYLQAVALVTNVGNINTIRLLESLSTSSKGLGSSAASGKYADMALGREHYQGQLPDFKNITNVALEASNSRTVSDATDLSVGKLLEIEIKDGEHKAIIPVSVRLNTKTINGKTLIHILGAGEDDKSFKERYHKWRSGEIRFMRDLILCQDIIDAHKDASIKDPTGLYSAIRKRGKSKKVSGLVSGNPSLNVASNIAVMTRDTVDDLEQELKGKFSSFRKREKLMSDAYLMLMVVVDTDYDVIEIYTRGSDDVLEVSASDLRKSNKGTGPDISEIMKSLMVGKAPTL